MKITIEIDSKKELEKLSALFEAFKINAVNVISSDGKKDLPVIKGNKKLDPQELFGIWAEKPRTLENIRKAAWHRNS
jgi:hypothetical protein